MEGPAEIVPSDVSDLSEDGERSTLHAGFCADFMQILTKSKNFAAQMETRIWMAIIRTKKVSPLVIPNIIMYVSLNRSFATDLIAHV